MKASEHRPSASSVQVTACAAVARNEIRLLLRDPAGLLMLFLMPALFIVILSVALQGVFSSGEQEDRLRVLVVDEEPDGRLGERLRNGIDDSRYFRLVNDDVKRDAALLGITAGRYDVVITVPEDATKALRLEADARVEVVLDPMVSSEIARTVEASVQSLVVSASIRELRGEQEKEGPSLGELRVAAEAPDSVRLARHQGVEVEQIYVGSGGAHVHPDAVQQYVPGWTVFALFWLAQILANNLISERASGIHLRIVASPMSALSYVSGKLVPYLLVNLLQAVAMFGVGVTVLPLLGAPRLLVTNLPALALITVAISLTSLSFGLFLAACFRSQVLVGVGSAAALIIMAVLGGVMVPKFVMPAFMQRLSLFVPHGWALDGYLDVLMRGASVRDVLPNVGALCCFAALPFAVAVLRRSRTL